MNGTPWTLEEEVFLQLTYPHLPTQHLTKFIKRTERQIYQHAAAMGLQKTPAAIALFVSRFQGDEGKAHRFGKGHVPWNKGLKGDPRFAKPNAGQFKRGNLPHNAKHDGAITIRRDKNGHDYKWIRVALGKWEMLHVHIWQQANGQVPHGHIVVFKDRNTLNCTLPNLELITREENMRRNTVHNLPEELKEVIHVKKSITRLINDRYGRKKQNQ